MPALRSDEFNSPTLDTSLWSFVDPVGDSSVSASGTQAVISVPGGVSHDLWTDANRAPRLLQAAPNDDFEVEVKFDNPVTTQYQLQGIVVEQDADDLLRFEVHYNGTQTILFAASMVAGNASSHHYSAVEGGAPAYLRLKRTGDLWTLRYSRDGENWTSTATFSHSLTVARLGPVAGNVGWPPPAFTSAIDYFRSIDRTPPTISAVSASATAIAATVTWTTDEPADSTVTYGPTEAHGSVITSASLTRSHALALRELACATTYHFEVRSTDAAGNEARSVDQTFATAPCAIRSDEFNSPALDTSVWSFVDPVGDATASASGTQAVISVPAGVDHDLWTDANRAPRLLQAAPNDDFEVEVKFDNPVTTQYQLQGIVVAEDADDLLRFEVHHNGAQTILFVASLVAGNASAHHYSAVEGGAPAYLRLKRAGEAWTLRYSRDGESWTNAATVSRSLTVARVGPFAGNVGSPPPAFTSTIDYFRLIEADRTSPTISAVNAEGGEIASTIAWTTDEPADSVVSYGLTAAYGSVASDSGRTTAHQLPLVRLACGTTYHFEVRSTDAAGNEARSGDQTFATAPCPTTIRSDEFNSLTLDTNVWSFVDPVGDATASASGTQAVISVPGGGDHDLWAGANRAPRLLQAAPNDDFEVEVKFDNPVTAQYQLQGIVVEQDDDDLLRLEVHHNGAQTQLFVAALVDGQATVKHYSAVAGGAPLYLNVKRVAESWTLRHSRDGSNWTSASFAHPLVPTRVGAFAGNVGSPSPAFISTIDYFRSIEPDRTPPAIGAVNASATAIAATVTWTTDEPADSAVTYGPTEAHGSVITSASLTRSHALALRGLACGMTYHFEMRSTDAAGNEARSGDQTFATAPCPTTIRSDEFNSPTLDTNVWSFVDPVGDATASASGTQAVISVPGGVEHDLWTDANRAPRLLQAAPNDDFEVEIKFDNPVTAQYQLQGIVVEQDADDLLRFEVHHNGTSEKLFVASLDEGVASVKHWGSAIGEGPMYLRVAREASTWALRYSRDGSIWTTVVRFSHPLTVSALGPFAGNVGSPTPAFISAVDYLRLIEPDRVPPTITGVSVGAEMASATVSWLTDELATSQVVYGTSEQYTASASVGGMRTAHAVTLSGLTCETLYHFQVRSRDGSANIAESADSTFTTGACPPPGGPEIEFWYGDGQRFGAVGLPQRWLNILGHVSDPNGLAWVDYSLNGSAPQNLAIDPLVNVRIARRGDFNVELDTLELPSGENQLEIIAADWRGDVSRKAITFHYDADNVWPQGYVADFGTASKIEDVAQVVDGRWSLEGSGVRTVAPGYDRLLAVGGMNWRHYDVTVPLTVHAFDASSPHAGVGAIVGWQGHTGTDRPRLGWPLGGLCFYFRNGVEDSYRLRIWHSDPPHERADDARDNRMQLGVPYMLKFEAAVISPTLTRYSCKLWRADAPEPSAWDVSADLSTRSGSVALVADYADVTFGTVTVRPLEPSQ